MLFFELRADRSLLLVCDASTDVKVKVRPSLCPTLELRLKPTFADPASRSPVRYHRSSLQLAIATDLRESVDQFRDVDYARYLSLLLPSFFHILKETPAVFDPSEVDQQKLRHMLLEIIQRLPHNESLRSWSEQIMGLMLALLRIENEDNGVVCIKIIIDHNRYVLGCPFPSHPRPVSCRAFSS